MSELLPCPFCGRHLEHEESISYTHHPKLDYGDYCPLKGFGFASDRRDIIAAWNARAVSHAQDVALRGAIATISIDDEGHRDTCLKLVLVAGYKAMKCALPVQAAEETIDAIIRVTAPRTPAASDIPERFKHEVAAIANELGMDHQDLTTGKIAEFARKLRAERDQAISQVEKAAALLEERAAGYDARGLSIFSGNIMADELRMNAEEIRAMSHSSTMLGPEVKA